METSIPTACEYARDRHKMLLGWRSLWTALLFIFGSAVILFLSIAVVFLLRSDWLPGALTTLGTIVSGASVRFVVQRRTMAVEEEEKAYRDVGRKCKDTVDADNLRDKMMLFRSFL